MRKLFFLLLSVTVSSIGQTQELGTAFLRGTWQASHTNPALFPKEKFLIRLPEIYDDIYISSVTYADLIGKDESGKKYLDIDQAIGRLDTRNQINEYLQVGTIGLGVNLGPVGLSLQHGFRYYALLDYPKTLPQLIWQGNAQFIGQEVDAGADVQLLGYHEVGLGAAVHLGEHITVGGRLKWLGGIAEASTQRHDLRIRTDEEAYALQLNADLLVNTSGAVTYDGFRQLSVDFNFGRFDLERTFGNNSGLAADLGVQLQFGKLDLAASVLDIGSIRWEDGARNYRLQGSYEFSGLDVAQGILADSTEFGSILDTLQNLLNVVETFQTYTTNLPRQWYASAGYQVNDTWRLGALFYSQQLRGETYTAAALGVNARFWPFLELGATYAWRNETFDNLGLNAVLRLGPLQVVAATDNILTALNLRDSHSANLRLGVNVAVK